MNARIVALSVLIFVPAVAAADALPEAPPEAVGMDLGRLALVSEAVADAVRAKQVPGGVVLVGRKGKIVHVGVHGLRAVVPTAEPMTRDTVFDMASLTKPITAAAALQLVEDGRLSLDSAVTEWVPELAAARVVRTPQSSLDDLVPPQRPITVEDLLTSRSGWGFPADFSLPALQALFAVQSDGRFPRSFPPAARWLAELAAVPMVAQPGSAFLYDTSLTMLGILIERVTGRRLGEQLAERIFTPLGMTDTSFVLRPGDMSRFARLYHVQDETLAETDSRSTWTTAPELERGNGNPTARTLFLLAGALGASVEELTATARRDDPLPARGGPKRGRKPKIRRFARR